MAAIATASARRSVAGHRGIALFLCDGDDRDRNFLIDTITTLKIARRCLRRGCSV
jgi:hypothetical protein